MVGRTGGQVGEPGNGKAPARQVADSQAAVGELEAAVNRSVVVGDAVDGEVVPAA